MKACVLIAAPPERMDALVKALNAFETLHTSDELRAELMATIGCFQAIVISRGFLLGLTQDEASESPLIRIEPTTNMAELASIVGARIKRKREEDLRRASELERLSTVPYSTYLELTRFRATRIYLLGLMRRYRGSVTEAGVAAGIARESLHRQLRRHDIDADAFRAPDPR